MQEEEKDWQNRPEEFAGPVHIVVNDESQAENNNPAEEAITNPLEAIADYDYNKTPVLTEEEVNTALNINSLSNEEIDARLQKLGEEIEERWQKRNNMVKDLEALGPAPDRIEILANAIVDEFETPQNAVNFVKMLVTKGGLTPHQKIVAIAQVAVNVIGKLIEGVKEIRRREGIVRQQIAVQGEIVVKTDEVKVLTAQKAENINGQTSANIQFRHEEATNAINQAVDRIASNTSEIDNKYSDYENERESNLNQVEDNGFNCEVSNRIGGLLDNLNNL